MPLLGLFSSIGVRIMQGMTAIGLYNVAEMVVGDDDGTTAQDVDFDNFLNPYKYAFLGVFGTATIYCIYSYFKKPKRRRYR